MSDETLRLVEQFHRAFGQTVQERPKVFPMADADRVRVARVWMSMRNLGEELKELAGVAGLGARTPLLRLQLLQEELAELASGFLNGDVVEVLDALTDLQYVLDGTYLATGTHAVKLAAFREVHRSNMSKLGEDGRPVLAPSGRVMKGPRYSPPDLRQFIEETTP